VKDEVQAEYRRFYGEAVRVFGAEAVVDVSIDVSAGDRLVIALGFPDRWLPQPSSPKDVADASIVTVTFPPDVDRALALRVLGDAVAALLPPASDADLPGLWYDLGVGVERAKQRSGIR
jgi:hypothetical protein